MELGPYADDVMDIVELVESGVIFRDPRPPLGPGLEVLHDMAEVVNYIHGHRWDWLDLLDFAGEPDSRRKISDKEDEIFDSVPRLANNLTRLYMGRVKEGLDRHLGEKYTSRDISFLYRNLGFILSHRATHGRSLSFIERLVEIYRLGGHPCGWGGPYPEGRLVAYFPPEDGSL